MTNMPKVDFNKISNELKDNPIFKIVVKKDGSIRASKPKVDENKPETGKAAYVWRMVCFLVSPKRQHQCMPVTANFDLPAYDENGKWSCSVSREMEKALKPIEDQIVDSIDKNQWHGVHRWGKAFGY